MKIECSKCGKKLDDGSIFCGFCGQKVEAPTKAYKENVAPVQETVPPISQKTTEKRWHLYCECETKKLYRDKYGLEQCNKCGKPVPPPLTSDTETPNRIQNPESLQSLATPAENKAKVVSCPKCGSTSVQAMKKGFNEENCCTGILCFGPIGSLLGLRGSNVLTNVCLNCGNTWELKAEQSACMTLWNCHKIPERSFHINGKPMPLCARCLGVIIGLFISIGLLLMSAIPPLITSTVLVAVILVDWGLQVYFGFLSTNIRRFGTGICGGIGATSVLFYIVKIF